MTRNRLCVLSCSPRRKREKGFCFRCSHETEPTTALHIAYASRVSVQPFSSSAVVVEDKGKQDLKSCLNLFSKPADLMSAQKNSNELVHSGKKTSSIGTFKGSMEKHATCLIRFQVQPQVHSDKQTTKKNITLSFSPPRYLRVLSLIKKKGSTWNYGDMYNISEKVPS